MNAKQNSFIRERFSWGNYGKYGNDSLSYILFKSNIQPDIMTDHENKQIIYNGIQCPDGTIIESRTVHDYKTHAINEGEYYVVDGGLNYLRRIGSNYKELALYTDDDHGIIRERFSWGTYGKYGNDSLSYVLLKDITTEHLVAIIKYTKNSPQKIHQLFINEKQWRNKIATTN